VDNRKCRLDERTAIMLEAMTVKELREFRAAITDELEQRAERK